MDTTIIPISGTVLIVRGTAPGADVGDQLLVMHDGATGTITINTVESPGSGFAVEFADDLDNVSERILSVIEEFEADGTGNRGAEVTPGDDARWVGLDEKAEGTSGDPSTAGEGRVLLHSGGTTVTAPLDVAKALGAYIASLP